MRTIGRLALRVTLCLGFLVCLSVVGASGATAQTCPGSGGSGGSAGSGSIPCASTTTSPILNTSTTVSGLALTGEQAALPLAAAAGIIVLVLGARHLRRRANN